MRFWTDDVFGEFIQAMNNRIAMESLREEMRKIYAAFLATEKENGGPADAMNSPILREMVRRRFEEELQMPVPMPQSLFLHLLTQILEENK